VTPSEADLLATRLARLQAIVQALQEECALSIDTRRKFDNLRSELDEIRRRLRVITLP
jgi:hypothetical protein